jgi:hypothetical protein
MSGFSGLWRFFSSHIVSFVIEQTLNLCRVELQRVVEGGVRPTDPKRLQALQSLQRILLAIFGVK